MNKQTIEIPEGYEFDHVASPILGNGGGVLSVILKKKQTKDFSFYVDQYLYDNGSTNDQIVNWLSEDIISIAKHRLKTSQFSLVPWEIKMGLFKFICEAEGQGWKIQTEMGLYSKNSAIKILPQEFINDLFKTKN